MKSMKPTNSEIFSKSLAGSKINIKSVFKRFVCRFRITNMASERRARLEKANDLQQLFRDIDDEESWIK